MKKLLEKELLTIEPEATLGDLVSIFIKSKRNVFPVVDAAKTYYGIIQLNDIRKLMFESDQYARVHAKDIMTTSPELVNVNDRMEQVIKKFEETHAWNLPVVDHRNRYVGMISQSTLFSVYRNQLLFHTEM